MIINIQVRPNQATSNMAIPNAFDDLDDLHYYQGIIIAEVASMLVLYIILKILHYLIWGADE